MFQNNKNLQFKRFNVLLKLFKLIKPTNIEEYNVCWAKVIYNSKPTKIKKCNIALNQQKLKSTMSVEKEKILYALKPTKSKSSSLPGGGKWALMHDTAHAGKVTLRFLPRKPQHQRASCL